LRSILGLVCLAVVVDAANAHFHMLLPARASVKRGEPVEVLFLWGHPFEHQLFEPHLPGNLSILCPDGKKVDATALLKESPAPGSNDRSLTTRLTPDQRGDHVVFADCAPVWMEEDQEFLHDSVKVIVHVQAQRGWDARTGQDFEMSPLTRPYGLEPKAVFQAQALWHGKPLPNALVQIERYNARPPSELPPDEKITRTAKTDPNGVVTCTLTSAGWWCITAEKLEGRRERNGKPYPVRRRATLWVFVDD
jgi:cobalt/nickel transport protein